MLSDAVHVPVLLKEILSQLVTEETRTVFDGTMGLGGHAKAILEKFGGVNRYIGTDLESSHLNEAASRLASWKSRLHLVNENFSSIKKIIQSIDSLERPLVILLDLGLCSAHIDEGDRGFSYQKDGPLQMTFGVQEKTAEEVLNTYEVKDLTQVLREYGEEPLAYKIAQAITQRRTHQPLRTTIDLRETIASVVHQGKVNGATKRVFQAIRMEVNDELQHLQKTLEGSLEIMEAGDRLGVITYHSLEDRLVKRFFQKHTKPVTQESVYSLHEEVAPPRLKALSKKPIVPQETECAQNPRARSAKLRMVERLSLSI